MPDKITTLKLVDNTDVFPNIKDENIPNTIMRIADLSKYLNQLKSINITGDIDSTTITSDIATFTTADISTLNVSRVSHFEGEATFGNNVHVDGNLVVYGIDNIFDKDGRKIVNTGSFDPMSDNPAGQKSTADYIVEERIKERFIACSNALSFNSCFAGLDFGAIRPNDILKDYCFNTIDKLEELPKSSLDGRGMFRESTIIDLGTWHFSIHLAMYKCSDLSYCFYGCSEMVTIGPFNETGDLSNCTNLGHAFDGCTKATKFKLIKISCSFDISETALDHDALVDIINNAIVSVETAQVLTMGATKLALLSDAEKKVATDKGWTLA